MDSFTTRPVTASAQDTGSSQDTGLARFNALSREDARAQLLSCCAAPAWVDGVLAGRPYADRGVLARTASSLAARLDRSGVEAALAGHPRIGERASGASAQGAAGGWSRTEQGGVSRDEQTLSALADGNRAYEQRFGRVFLICAPGLSGEQILASLTERLGHDADTEQLVMREELRKIALLRLTKAVQGGPQ